MLKGSALQRLQETRQRRDELLRLNGGLYYRSYFALARRYLLRAHDVAVHPTGRVPSA